MVCNSEAEILLNKTISNVFRNVKVLLFLALQEIKIKT